MKRRPLTLFLFIAAATLLWLPFKSDVTLYSTRPGGALPVGEIRAGFVLVQNVQPPGVHETSELGGRQSCAAVRFATYARHNRGRLRVSLRQDGNEQAWRVAAFNLADNSYRHFCPDFDFSPFRPFHLEVAGIDSPPGKAATLWTVTDTRLGSAHLLSGGDLSPRRSVALQASVRRRIGSGEMARIGNGAWLIGWLCTVAIGILALTQAFAKSRFPDG